MAKVTGGLLSLGARGTVGDTLTFAAWKGQPYVRQRVVPANPKTTAQVSTRTAFNFAVQVWKNAGPLLRAPWNRAAAGASVLGDNLFIGSFVSNVRGETDLQSMIFSDGAKGGPAPVSVTPTPGDDQVTVVVVPPTPPTGWSVSKCVAAVIPDQDYSTDPPDYYSVEASDDTDPYSIVLSGLQDATDYVGGGWIEYAKPDGSVAYSTSIQFTATTT